MSKETFEIGMVGLGVMGRNLVLNMSDYGISVAGYDKDVSKVAALEKDAVTRNVFSAKAIPEFIKALRKPRAIMFLVPAGPPVDSVIADLSTYLEPDDLIIDAGNSHFKDTDRRGHELHQKKIHFMGMGVSGGEFGARFGPSLMPGGPREAYDRIESSLKSIAAKVGGDSCVTYLGPRSAGHYVKMVHNGIEYALMQLIAETYDIMKRGLGFSNDELHAAYAEWNDGELASYLLEITTKIFLKQDDKTENRLIDVILDAARQLGTGKWTSQDAMDLQVPVPTIDTAVAMRDMSGYKLERVNAAKILPGPKSEIAGDKKAISRQLKNAFHFAMIVTYAQGMALLYRASEKYEYDLKLKDIAMIWKGGCIIRANFLENIRQVFEKKPALRNLLIDPDIAETLSEKQQDLRNMVGLATNAGIPASALSASLAYYDAYRRAELPANLIQAQRDYFGAHTYERLDQPGIFHTQWVPN